MPIDTDERGPRRMTPIRPTALIFGLLILAIVWMSYHYTHGLIAEGLELIGSAQASDVKEGIIQILSAVVNNMVALTAIGGLISAVNKLTEN